MNRMRSKKNEPEGKGNKQSDVELLHYTLTAIWFGLGVSVIERFSSIHEMVTALGGGALNL